MNFINILSAACNSGLFVISGYVAMSTFLLDFAFGSTIGTSTGTGSGMNGGGSGPRIKFSEARNSSFSCWEDNFKHICLCI